MTTARRLPTEHQEQAWLVTWARTHKDKRLHLLYANANGGFRNKVTAWRLRAEGVLPGVPDLFLPVARGQRWHVDASGIRVEDGPWHGLFLEMKRVKGGAVSRAQLAIAGALREQGYMVVICQGWLEGKAAIEAYLDL